LSDRIHEWVGQQSPVRDSSELQNSSSSGSTLVAFLATGWGF
jgi:hypothetical protein